MKTNDQYIVQYISSFKIHNSKIALKMSFYSPKWHYVLPLWKGHGLADGSPAKDACDWTREITTCPQTICQRTCMELEMIGNMKKSHWIYLFIAWYIYIYNHHYSSLVIISTTYVIIFWMQPAVFFAQNLQSQWRIRPRCKRSRATQSLRCQWQSRESHGDEYFSGDSMENSPSFFRISIFSFYIEFL